MTKAIGQYRGAKIFEIEEFESSDGEKIGSKIIAKAILPNQQNMKVDFVEKSDTLQKARKKIEKTIDQYLDEHEFERFDQ